MRSFVAKRFETRPAGLSLDTEALARYADVIDLSIGDTDFTRRGKRTLGRTFPGRKCW